MKVMSEAGFTRPGYAQLLEEQETRAKQTFGEEIDTGEHTALGKFIRIGVYDLARLYEEMEGVYLSRFPHLAKGVGLDRLTPFAGIHRNPAVAAVHKVRISGVAETEVAEGFLLGTVKGVYMRTLEKASLNGEGTAAVKAECIRRGIAGNVASSEICVVVNPQLGVHAANGVEQLVEGRERENDEELRGRFDLAVQGVGSATGSSIRAAVLRVPGVSSCQVLENGDDVEDSAGMPPHSFACYVLAEGADEQEVGGAIFAKKPIGIKSHGTQKVQVRDVFGGSHEVRFFPVEKLWLAVKVHLEVNALFPKEGVQMAKRAIAMQVSRLTAGKELVVTALYPALYELPGVEKAEGLMVSLNAGVSWQQENVAAKVWQALRLTEAAVQLEVQVNG